MCLLFAANTEMAILMLLGTVSETYTIHIMSLDYFNCIFPLRCVSNINNISVSLWICARIRREHWQIFKMACLYWLALAHCKLLQWIHNFEVLIRIRIVPETNYNLLLQFPQLVELVLHLPLRRETQTIVLCVPYSIQKQMLIEYIRYTILIA